MGKWFRRKSAPVDRVAVQVVDKPARGVCKMLVRRSKELAERVEQLENRLAALETSDFAKNRETYDRIMSDLRSSNPGTILFPE